MAEVVMDVTVGHEDARILEDNIHVDVSSLGGSIVIVIALS